MYHPVKAEKQQRGLTAIGIKAKTGNRSDITVVGKY